MKRPRRLLVFVSECPRPYGSCTRTLVQQLREQLVSVRPNRVVELGCGTGGVAWWLAREARVRLVGIDHSWRATQIARERGTTADPPVAFVCGDFSRLPLATESADVAVSVDALPFAPDLAEALSEVRRILRPGGWLLFTNRGAKADGSALRLPAKWSDALEENDFQVVRLVTRPEVSDRLKSLYALWIESERRLREELPAISVDGMMNEAREVGATLDDGRPWLLATVSKR